MQKSPLSVRIIAIALMVSGIESIVSLLVDFFLFGRFGIDLGPLLLPLGLGLVRRSEYSRGWTVFLAGTCVIFTSLAIVFHVVFLFVPQPKNVTLGNLAVTLVALLIFSTAWWMLTSRETKDWFALGKLDRSKRRLQFGTSTMLIWMTVFAVLCTEYRSVVLYHPRKIESKIMSKKQGIESITYGYRRSRYNTADCIVDFVVLESNTGKGTFTSSVSSIGSSGLVDIKATLITPSGEEIELPGENQLFEIRDDVFRSLPGTVTKSQLDAFLQSSDTNRTIEDLLAMPVSED